MKKIFIVAIAILNIKLKANDTLSMKNGINFAYSIGYSNSEYNKTKYNSFSKLIKCSYERRIFKHQGFIGIAIWCNYSSGTFQQNQLFYNISKTNVRFPVFIGSYIPLNDKISLKIAYGFSYNFLNITNLSNSNSEFEISNERNTSMLSEIGLQFKINNKHSLQTSFNYFLDFNYSSKTNSKELGETLGLGYKYTF